MLFRAMKYKLAEFALFETEEANPIEKVNLS